MEINNNNNMIMPSIYANPEVQYTNYLHVGNSFDSSCGNYFSRVEQEKISSQFMFWDQNQNQLPKIPNNFGLSH
jgi:hypothetical protein